MTTIDSQILELNVDSVKFCPVEQFNNLILTGLYMLQDKDSQKVIGGFHLYDSKNFKLELITKEQNMAGVFDLIWINKFYNKKLYFVVGFVDSFVRIFSVQIDGFATKLEKEIQIGCNSSCLQLDVIVNSEFLYILVSSNNEKVNYIKLSFDFEIQNQIECHNHQWNVWCCALLNQNVFLSGGDDCKLIVYDERSNGMVMSNSKIHKMGVTCISVNQNNPEYFITGSYDENLRLWDIRNLKDCVNSINFDGGVWRAVWKPYTNDQIACGIFCQKKYNIISFDQSNQLFGGIVQTYSNHDSLAYGIDWKHSQENILSSISFYDNKLNLWKIE